MPGLNPAVTPPSTLAPPVRAYRMGNHLALDERGGAAVTPHPCLFTDDDLAHHMTVLGGTGSGKSKFLERLMRCFMHGGRGFCFIDPHGDTSEDLLAYVAWQKQVEGDVTLFPRVHYLEPSYEMIFGYDPFQFRPLHAIPEEAREAAYEAWLHTKVDRVSEIIQRKQGQMGFDGMPRLQRMLRNVLYATGRAVNRHGTHLPLADALVLLDLEHPRHADVFARVAPFLDRDILSDFEILHGFKRVEELRRETESTVNRLRSLLGPVVRGVFSETVDTIDFHSIMQRGEILLVNLRETDYFSADQKNAIGGLFIHEVLTTAANTPREDRKEFSLIIDEVGEFVGEDLLRALGAVRKYKLSLVLAGQDLSTFQKGELDVTQKVLSQCGTVVCFQQTFKTDLEILADRLGRGNLTHDELYTVADRPDGYDLLDMEDYARGFNWVDNWSEGGAVSDTETSNWSRSIQEARQQTWSRADSLQEGVGHTDTAGLTTSDSASASLTDAPVMRHGTKVGTVEVPSASTSRGRAALASRADSRTSMSGRTNTEGGGLTLSDGRSDGGADARGVTRNAGVGGSNGGSWSVSHKKQVIPRTREEWHPTGRRRVAYADQFEMLMSLLYGLERAQAVVKLRSRKEAVAIQVAHVKEMWHPDNKFKKIEELKAILKALRTYFAPLRIGNAAQRERIDAYLQTEERLPDAGSEPQTAVTPHPKQPSANGHGHTGRPSGAAKPVGENPYGT